MQEAPFTKPSDALQKGLDSSKQSELNTSAQLSSEAQQLLQQQSPAKAPSEHQSNVLIVPPLDGGTKPAGDAGATQVSAKPEAAPKADAPAVQQPTTKPEAASKPADVKATGD